MRISDWSSDVCSSDLVDTDRELLILAHAVEAHLVNVVEHAAHGEAGLARGDKLVADGGRKKRIARRDGQRRDQEIRREFAVARRPPIKGNDPDRRPTQNVAGAGIDYQPPGRHKNYEIAKQANRTE